VTGETPQELTARRVKAASDAKKAYGHVRRIKRATEEAVSFGPRYRKLVEDELRAALKAVAA
jgi:hypothetical protein